MEHRVGEPFRVYGVAYVAVADTEDNWGCRGCVVYEYCRSVGGNSQVFGPCSASLRSDGCSVHFEQFGVDF